MLVIEIFPSSAELRDAESNSSQSASSSSEVRLKFSKNLVCVKAFIGEKFDHDHLFHFQREDW
jgi:hypothetical protein